MQVINGKVTTLILSHFEDQPLISTKADKTDFATESYTSTSDLTTPTSSKNKLTLAIGDWCAAYIADFEYW